MELPVKNIPGEVFEYKNIDSHLLSAIRTKSHGNQRFGFCQCVSFSTFGYSSE
jgi:hypothetical protein